MRKLKYGEYPRPIYHTLKCDICDIIIGYYEDIDGFGIGVYCFNCGKNVIKDQEIQHWIYGKGTQITTIKELNNEQTTMPKM